MSILAFHHIDHEFSGPVIHGSLSTHTVPRLGTEKLAECVRRIASGDIAARNGLDTT